MRALPVLVALAALAPTARADATIIRDDRIGDLGVTPSLGRGFSLASNTLQSVCFDALPTTTASFDFDYTFQDVGSDATSTTKLDRRFDEADVTEFLRVNTHETQVGKETTRKFVHYMLAALTVDSYYSSIDEGHAKLSDAALKLLRTGSVLDFVTSCGTHYIRSISRRSYFLTLFSYTSKDSARDQQFEMKLQEEVRSLNVDGKDSKAELDDKTTFDNQAHDRELRIVTKSIGLKADLAANLIPFDLKSYQDTVKEAFKATQDEFVGRISAMEIVPWVSNPIFLASIDLSDLAAPGGPKVSRFIRKQLLADNAEFYVALVGVVQERQARIHRALVCRQELDEHILVDGKIPPELATAQLVNHRTGERAPLSTLLDALAPDKLAQLDASQKTFTQGDGTNPGAAACIDELERGQLSTKPHDDIPACVSVASRLGGFGSTVIDDYCMPEIDQRGR